MIQITPQMRVLVAIEPIDGRKGIDALVRLCQDQLAEDPFSGCVFVFRSRRGTAIRLLSYDGQGYWLAQKRLSKGRFVWWPEAAKPAKPLEAYLTGGFPYRPNIRPASPERRFVACSHFFVSNPVIAKVNDHRMKSEFKPTFKGG
jgi:transposase